jgi:hypothetical protein
LNGIDIHGASEGVQSTLFMPPHISYSGFS